MHRRKFHFHLYIFLFITLFSCKNNKESLPYYNTPDFTPQWLNEKEAATVITHTIDSFKFQNQKGETISNENLKGKIHVANFFFTSCPSICPKMTIEFQSIQKAFEKETDVILLSYSVTPWRDSVAKLEEFAKNHSVLPGKWHLLTGEKSKIYSLARQSYFAEEEIGYTKDSTEFLHTEHFILVDKTGRIRGIYNGTLTLETERLIADIRTLKEME
jgi:protein SCO1/2